MSPLASGTARQVWVSFQSFLSLNFVCWLVLTGLPVDSPVADRLQFHLTATIQAGEPVLAAREGSLANHSKVTELRRTVAALEPLQRRLDPPKKGEWLAAHQEDGQTFDQFLSVRPKPISSRLSRFYLQPIGTLTKTQDRLVEETSSCLQTFYGRQVVTLPGIELAGIPAEAQRYHPTTGQKQILTTFVLDKLLVPRRPQDAVAVLALVGEDLWPGKGWNFVFGQASLSERVGVWSIQRLGNPDDGQMALKLCRERMWKLALHESGHMLGIKHCKAWDCCMNGSNHLAESDARAGHFCSECQPKVWFACSLTPDENLKQLIKLASDQGLEDLSSQWKSELDAIIAVNGGHRPNPEVRK